MALSYGTQLVLLIAGCCLLGRSARPPARQILGENKKKENIVLIIVIGVMMILFCGLRTSYNDTYFYLFSYTEHGQDLSQFLESDGVWSLGANPGFNFLQAVLYTVTDANPYAFIMFFAVITLTLMLKFIKNYSSSFAFSLFLYMTFGGYLMAFAAIKQCLATAIGLWGVEFGLKKKWLRFVLLILLASTVHPYVLMFLALPLMNFTPWSGKTYASLALFGAAGVMLQFLFGAILSVTDILGEGYTEASVSGEGLNGFRFLVYAVPLILSYVYREKLFRDSTRAENIMVNFSMVCGEIAFVGLFGNANTFGRLAIYFITFEVISIPWMLKKIEPGGAGSLTVGAVIGYLAFFYYGNYMNKPFSDHYKRAALSEFFGSFFK